MNNWKEQLKKVEEIKIDGIVESVQEISQIETITRKTKEEKKKKTQQITENKTDEQSVNN